MSLTTCRSDCRMRRRRGAGFTLIEVLVVVAIIALLISILLPSLQAARNQAKLVSCKANLKQIATSIATYQTEFSGYVPVLLNDAASFVAGTTHPARACWVSVALRMYASQTRSLGTRTIGGATYDFDPESKWTIAMRDAYESQIMPEFYTCSFQRGKGSRRDQVWNESFYRMYQKEGRFDTIQTWLSENVVKGQVPPHGLPWQPASTKASEGVPKYTAFSWNCLRSAGTFKDGTAIPAVPNAQSFGTAASTKTYRRWTDADVRRMRSGSFSTTTVAFCAQGEHILGDQPNGRIGWANRGSHRSGEVGGTNVIFADAHVEWVPGKQVGWP